MRYDVVITYKKQRLSLYTCPISDPISPILLSGYNCTTGRFFITVGVIVCSDFISLCYLSNSNFCIKFYVQFLSQNQIMNLFENTHQNTNYNNWAKFIEPFCTIFGPFPLLSTSFHFQFPTEDHFTGICLHDSNRLVEN